MNAKQNNLKNTLRPSVFYVARHGETTWNIERRLQGHLDSPLTARGEEQAKKLGDSLTDVSFTRAYTSDMLRSQRTAEIILLEKKIAIETTALLRERSFGRWEGKTYDEYNTELKIDFDKLERLTHAERRKYKPSDEVENDEEIVGRFLTFIREAAVAHPGETMLVVSHGGIMRATLVHLGIGSYQELRMGAIGNGAYFVLESDGTDMSITKMHNITVTHTT